MTLKAYSIRDAKAEIYNSPFYAKTHGEAERMFKSSTNDPQSMICKYPEDYDLYHVATFDDNSGIFTALSTPQHIVKAVNLKDS